LVGSVRHPADSNNLHYLAERGLPASGFGLLTATAVNTTKLSGLASVLGDAWEDDIHNINDGFPILKALASPNNTSLSWPANSGEVTLWFGYVDDIFQEFHYGIDIQDDIGAPIRSISNAVVTDISPDAFTGQQMTVNFNLNGIPHQAIYRHLATVSVNVGDTISRGQEIGTMSSFEIRDGDEVIGERGLLELQLKRNGEFIDPAPLMQRPDYDWFYLSRPMATSLDFWLNQPRGRSGGLPQRPDPILDPEGYRNFGFEHNLEIDTTIEGYLVKLLEGVNNMLIRDSIIYRADWINQQAIVVRTENGQDTEIARFYTGDGFATRIENYRTVVDLDHFARRLEMIVLVYHFAGADENPRARDGMQDTSVFAEGNPPRVTTVEVQRPPTGEFWIDEQGNRVNPGMNDGFSAGRVDLRLSTNMRTVIFEAGGATGRPPQAISFALGSSITLPIQGELTKEGHVFLGWEWFEPDNIQRVGRPGQQVRFGADITVQAIWGLVVDMHIYYDSFFYTNRFPTVNAWRTHVNDIVEQASMSFASTFRISFNYIPVEASFPFGKLFCSTRTAPDFLCRCLLIINPLDSEDCGHHSSIFRFLHSPIPPTEGQKIGLHTHFFAGRACLNRRSGIGVYEHSGPVRGAVLRNRLNRSTNGITVPPGTDPVSHEEAETHRWQAIRVAQHEWSHSYGTEDCVAHIFGPAFGCTPNEPCVMRQDFINERRYHSNVWCTRCREIIMNNRTLHARED